MAAAESSSSVVSAEALTYTLCLSSENRAYSEGRTEAGYNSLFSWRECGIREEYLFPNHSVSVLQAAHSAGIRKSKNNNNKTLGKLTE